MTTNTESRPYIGHRYVPLLMGEWELNSTYEGLSIVTYQGASFTSKKRVPVGIDILNEAYWVVTGNYDAQVEQYRQDVREQGSALEGFKEDVNTHQQTESAKVKVLQAKRVNVESFPRLADETDDNGRIMRAYATVSEGDTFIIPTDYLIRNIVMDKDHIHYDVSGKLIQTATATGAAVQIGNSTKRTKGISASGGFRIEKDVPADMSLPVSWGDVDSTGLRLVNVYESTLFVKSIDRFRKGLILQGTNSNGCVYNNIHLSRIVNNKTNIGFETNTGGWVNQNSFYGGALNWFSSVVGHPSGASETIQQAFTRLGTVHLNIPDKDMNNNVFYSTSFETPMINGVHIPSGKFINCNGRYNKFFGIRLEGEAVKVHFGQDSLYNDIHAGYLTTFTKGVHHLDEGTRNKIYGRDSLLLNSTLVEANRFKVKEDPSRTPDYTDGDGVFDAQSTRTSTDKLFKGRKSTGEETFSVDGLGNASFSEVVKSRRMEAATLKVGNFEVDAEGRIIGAPKMPLIASLPNPDLNRNRFLIAEVGGKEDFYISMKQTDGTFKWLKLTGTIV